MAHALVSQIGGGMGPGGGQIGCTVMFLGADVPGGVREERVFVGIVGQSLASLKTALIAACIAEGAAHGLTVADTNVWLPSYSRGP